MEKCYCPELDIEHSLCVKRESLNSACEESGSLWTYPQNLAPREQALC